MLKAGMPLAVCSALLGAATTAIAAGTDQQTIKEAVHKGQSVRALLDHATSTLMIEVNGRVAGTAKDVGEFKQPVFLSGSSHSLVSIWTKNAAQTCSTYVIVKVPMRDGMGDVEVKPGFGGCNPLTRTIVKRRGTWEFPASIAYRDDSAKVSVAVVRANNKLSVTEHAAQPCLFERNDTTRCAENVIAAGLGSAERGMPTGEALAENRPLTSYYNASKNSGSLDLDGKQFKLFPKVKELHVESALATRDAAVFSVWLHPEGEACGHREVVQVRSAGGKAHTLDKVGACRPKSAVRARTKPDNTVVSWAQVMWREGDQTVDILSYTPDDGLNLSQIRGDTCLLAPRVTNECVALHFPSSGRQAAAATSPAHASGSPGSAADGASQANAAPIQPNATLTEAFGLLKEGKLDAALAAFDRALMAEPSNAQAFAGRGYGLAVKGKLDNAMMDLDRAIQLNPRFAHAYAYRGYVFLVRNEPDRALAQLDQALLIAPNFADALAFRGAALTAKNELDAALDSLSKAIALSPKNPVAFGYRARVHALQNEHAKAVEDFTAALALSPANIALHLFRGQLLEALKNTRDALTAFRAAIALKPTSPNDSLMQALASQRIEALTTGLADKSSGTRCANGQTCL